MDDASPTEAHGGRDPRDPARGDDPAGDVPGLAAGAPLLPEAAARDPARLAAVVAAVLDQQSRDAAANRAQAREVIRAIEGLAKSHEFLGLELRQERRRARSLLVALAVVPLAVVAAGAFLARGVSDADARVAALRDEMGREIASLRERGQEDRIAAVRREFEDRIAAAQGDAAVLRTDLDAARESLAAERTARETRDREVAARLADADRDRSELSGLRAEVASLRDVAGSERARADELMRLLREDAAVGGPAVARAAAEPADPAEPQAAPRTAGPPAAATPAPVAPPSAVAPPPRLPDPAARDPRDLERIRAALNGLLDGLTGAARYEIEALSGVSGTDLLGIRVTGRDTAGRTLRTVEAARAEISVAAEGAVRLRFTDGHLRIAGRTAPFFEGSYTIVLDGSADAWRRSGLTCVRLL